MNFKNYTIKSQESIQRAQQIAAGNETQSVEVGHVLKGMLEEDDNVLPFIFNKLGINLDVIETKLRKNGLKNLYL